MLSAGGSALPAESVIEPLDPGAIWKRLARFGAWTILPVRPGDPVESEQDDAAAQVVLSLTEALEAAPANPDLDPDAAELAPELVSSRLVAALTRPPSVEVPGVRLAGSPQFDITPEQNGSDQIRLGEVLDAQSRPAGWFGLTRSSLNRHMFVCGARLGDCVPQLQQVAANALVPAIAHDGLHAQAAAYPAGAPAAINAGIHFPGLNGILPAAKPVGERQYDGPQVAPNRRPTGE